MSPWVYQLLSQVSVYVTYCSVLFAAHVPVITCCTDGAIAVYFFASDVVYVDV